MTPPTTTPLERVVDALEAHGCQPRRSGTRYQAKCPTHEDGTPSLSVSENPKGDALVTCHAGCPTETVVLAIGLTMADLFAEQAKASGSKEIAARYPYTDEAGDCLYEVVRYAPKDFRQRCPDGQGGWTWSLNGVRRVLYRLPDVLKARAADRWVLLTEGEKDADLLCSLGFVATTGSAGAGKWRTEYAEALKGAKVAILPDNDEPGHQHAQEVAASLGAVASRVVVIELDGLPPKGDVTDWIVAGHTGEELKQLIASAPVYDPGAPDLAGDTPGSRMLYRRSDSIEPSRPEWLWPSWLVKGALHLLIGRQGGGKTTWASWLLAQITNGAPLPGEAGARAPMMCAILSLEESDDRLVGRLQANGAVMDRILILGDVKTTDAEGRHITQSWRLPQGLGALEEFLSSHDVALVVIDGLGYSVTGDNHNYGVIGAALSALRGVAERTGTAILGLTHPPKGAADPVTAAIGSTAWTAVPRITWVLGADPNDESLRVVRVGKTNYREPDSGVGFRIGDNELFETGFVRDVQRSSVSAEILTSTSLSGEERTDREEARDFLRDTLNGAPMEQRDVVRLARIAGISDMTLKRARKDLGVRSARQRDPTGRRISGWVLSLPDAQNNAVELVGHPHCLGDPKTQRLQGHPVINISDPQDVTRDYVCSLEDQKRLQGLEGHKWGTAEPLGPATHPEPCQGCGQPTKYLDPQGAPLCLGCVVPREAS